MRRIRLAVSLGLAGFATAATAALAATGATLKASSSTIAFGASVSFSGVVPGAAAGADVQILSKACGFTEPIEVGTTKAGAGGKVAFKLEPTLNSTFAVRSGETQSNTALVVVRPQVQLRRVGPKLFAVDVSVGAGQFFTTKVALQRYDTARKRWLPAATGVLKQNSDPGAVIAVSTASVRAAFKTGTKIRASATKATLGACYAPATSAALTA